MSATGVDGAAERIGVQQPALDSSRNRSVLNFKMISVVLMLVVLSLANSWSVLPVKGQQFLYDSRLPGFTHRQRTERASPALPVSFQRHLR